MKNIIKNIGRKILNEYRVSKYLTKIKEGYRIRKNGQLLSIRKGTSDIQVIYDIFINESYMLSTEEKEIKIIVDCGANIGVGTLYFNMKYPEARIIAIEPENSNYEILKKNTENIKNIELLQAGLWNKECFLEVRDIGFDKWGFIVEEVKEKTERSIKAESIQSIIEKFNLEKIDILKIDIEGSEKEVFENAEWLDKVGILIIELHDRMKEGCAENLFKAISNYKYHFELRGENLIFYFKHNNK